MDDTINQPKFKIGTTVTIGDDILNYRKIKKIYCYENEYYYIYEYVYFYDQIDIACIRLIDNNPKYHEVLNKDVDNKELNLNNEELNYLNNRSRDKCNCIIKFQTGDILLLKNPSSFDILYKMSLKCIVLSNFCHSNIWYYIYKASTRNGPKIRIGHVCNMNNTYIKNNFEFRHKTKNSVIAKIKSIFCSKGINHE